MTSPLPTGTFTQSYRHATVSLYNQPQGVTQPVYGSKAIIKGDVVLHGTESITSVSLQIEGTLQLFTGISGRTSKIVDESYTLWSSAEAAPGTLCPTKLPFSTVFPSLFSPDNDLRQLPLPPTIDLPADLSRISVKSDYRLMITVTQRILFITQTKYVPIPITYYPRERPLRSMFSSKSPYLLGAIKLNPDEWTQHSSTVEPRAKSLMGKVKCHFFVPSAERYRISDSIPFHVQLAGPLRSLSQMHFPFKDTDRASETSLPPRYTNSLSSITQMKLPPNPTRPYIFRTEKECTMRVYLLRHVITCVSSRKGIRSVILGEGVLRESNQESAPNYKSPPPGLGPPTDSPPKCVYGDLGDDILVDWEGEVKVYDKSTAASFDSSCVSFTDYLVLHVNPIRNTGGLLEMLLKHPIKLVADPWVEDHFVYANGTLQGTRNGNFT